MPALQLVLTTSTFWTTSWPCSGIFRHPRMPVRRFKVLNASINFIHSVVTARGRGITSSFSLPSKPHHALQQKRRSIAGTVPMWDSIIPRQPRQHLPSHASPAAPTSLQFGISSVPFARAGFAVPTSPGGRHLASGQDNVLIAHLRSAASEEFARLVQRRLSHDGVVCAREAELTQRLQRVSVMAVNRLLFHDTSYDAVDIGDLPAAPVFVWPQTREQPADDAVHETTSPRVLLQEGVFRLMAEGLKNAVEGARGLAPCQQWCRLLSSCRETFRVQFARLLLHVLSPLRPFSERLLGLSLLLEPSCKEILREVLTTPLQPGPKLAVSAFELLWEKSGQLSRQEQKSVELLLTLLKQAGTKIPGSCPAWPETLDTLHMEVENWNKEEAVNRESWWRRMVTTQQELLGRIEARGRVISRAAAQVTQRVASRQGLERKRVMEHLREACKADLGTQHSWQTLFCQLTHERAVWFDPVACPLSWQLDPTEGPSRERRRLQRCRVHVPNKYLLKDRRQSDDMSQPLLSYLFEDKSHFSGASAVKDRATSEPTKFTRHCISIVPSRETPGELLLGEKGMYFVEDNAGDSAEGLGCTGDAEPLSFSWAYEDIKEVHLRWFQLRDNALEIFLINGRTLLLNFESTKVRDQVYQSVLSTELPNLLEYRNLHALTQLWSSGQITNFEYLTHLNKHAGRSFNDLMQYPVMPFVLSDYTSEMLNLTDLQVYRNLAKPIAVQSKVKEDRYVHNYKWLEEEFQKGGREDDPMPPVQPYHYGSHYSNSGTTLHFLVRLPPFTKMFLVYQDQSFDIPDRTFHSMYTTWRLSSYESSTDVKELIPEFFYMPEFLLNREGFDFGTRQNGSPVHHVSLPPWARSDPRLFVLIHRQALESDHMSLTLCHWIDLVFGHKQKGRAAVQAINVFHPATYFGMDVSAVEDPVQQRALETMIRTYGQTPRQLFTVSHPSRCPVRSPSETETTSAMGMLVQFAFRESHDVPRDVTGPSPLPWIRGLKWGEYVGSPSCPDPVVCFSQAHPGQTFGCLLPLPTRTICGLAQNFCLLMTYSKEQGVRTMHSTDIQWSAILSWGYVDNSLRLKSKQTGPALILVQCDSADEVCCCAWTPDSRQLYTGNRAGVLTVYSTHFSSTVPLELELERKVCFYGHRGGIAALHVCKPFSVLVSASQDGTCILWDLNRLCYVQSLSDHKSPVNAISVSDTTGDVASACHSVGGGSDLRLWTVNGDLIGHMHSPEAVCSLAFSNQPEGVSVNVIAGGLENGVVRLWSTWDLKAIRDIMYPKCSLSITSLTFSVDGLYLFTADEEGKVMSWCRRDHVRNKPPLFYSFLSGFAE
uniref:lysosomal-trafficking regulator-like isoform X2 n=1 Tax=Myxine glutinosa TaxID=7769 RepID=UPI00358EB0E6